MCRSGKMPAHITAKSVMASAARLTEVRHFCRNRKRIGGEGGAGPRSIGAQTPAVTRAAVFPPRIQTSCKASAMLRPPCARGPAADLDHVADRRLHVELRHDPVVPGVLSSLRVAAR